MKLDPIIEAPYMLTGLWRRFAVTLFEGKVTLADMDRIERASERWHAKVTGKVVEMVVILPTNTKMTQAERVRMARIIKRWEHTRVASATVILAQSLLGAVQRSVLTGLQLLAPSPHPTKVFGEVSEATVWLAPHVQEVCGEDANAAELSAAITELSALFSQRAVRAPMTDG